MEYKLPDNTFHMDFMIAEKFGIDAVKDTFKRAFNEWKTNYQMLTALVMTMNQRCWMHYENNNIELSKLYSSYYYKADDYALNNLTGEEYDYYFNVTD